MMIYCPECGSEVAKNDIFCQYCGIALTPIQTGDISNSAPVEEPKSEPEISSVVETSADENESPKIEELPIEDAVPGTPLVLTEDFQPPVVQTEDFQPPVAHLEELLNNPVPEPLVEESPNVEPKVEEPIAEPVIEKPPLIINEIPPVQFESSPIVENVSDQVLPDTPTLSEAESVPSDSGLAVADLEAPTPPPVLDTVPETIENNAEENFEATIPYVPSDYVNNDLQFSNSEISALDRISEYKEVIEGNPPFTQSNSQETTPPTFELGVFPKVESTPEPLPVPEQIAVSDFDDEIENTPTVINKEIPIISSELPPVFIAPPISAPIEQATEQKVEPKVEVANPPIESGNVEGRAYTNPINGEKLDTDGKSKTKLKPLEEGITLNNRYEIIRKIGGGGMGAVYLASDKNLGGVNRAVKEMVQSYIEEAQQEKAIADFKRESMLLTSLDHIAIPTIFDYFYDEKEARFYLVMKYISGGDLAGKMRSSPEGRIDEVTITDWAIQIADVLEYLHRHEPPIVYRDLKPSNIMIDGNSGKIMLIDFGIARWVNKEEKGVTAVGTMGYAPPELFSGNVEPRSDIYSLGSTMFHLLTGADPQSNPLLIFDFNKNPRPRQINSQLSDQIEQIVMRAVEYNASQRFSSAAEMRDALMKHLDNLKRGSVTFGVAQPTGGQPLTGNLPVFCGFCGQKILATDMFCPFCGAQQPLADQSKRLQNAPVYSVPKTTARLLIIGTNELEQTEFNLEKENNLVGRRDPMSNIFPEVDLSKYDPQTKISRKHARIWRENDLFMLEDLGSSNGTVLVKVSNESSRLLPRQPHILSHGDKIRVGDTTLRFTIN